MIWQDTSASWLLAASCCGTSQTCVCAACVGPILGTAITKVRWTPIEALIIINIFCSKKNVSGPVEAECYGQKKWFLVLPYAWFTVKEWQIQQILLQWIFSVSLGTTHRSKLYFSEIWTKQFCFHQPHSKQCTDYFFILAFSSKINSKNLDSKRRFGVFLGNGRSKVTSKWLNSKKKINATTFSQKNAKNVVKWLSYSPK